MSWLRLQLVYLVSGVVQLVIWLGLVLLVVGACNWVVSSDPGGQTIGRLLVVVLVVALVLRLGRRSLSS